MVLEQLQREARCCQLCCWRRTRARQAAASLVGSAVPKSDAGAQGSAAQQPIAVAHNTHTLIHTRCVPVSETASLLHDLPGAPTGARACVCVAQLPVASALCPRPRVRPRACLSVCDRARTQLQARTGRQRIEDSRCVKSPLLITDLTSASTTLSSRSPLALTHCVSDERPACDASRRHRSSHGQARDQGAEPEDQ